MLWQRYGQKDGLIQNLDLRVYCLKNLRITCIILAVLFCLAFCKSASAFMPKGYTETCASWCLIKQRWVLNFLSLQRAQHRVHIKKGSGPHSQTLPSGTLSSPGTYEGKLWPLVTLGNISHNPWLINIDIWDNRAEKKKGLCSKKKKSCFQVEMFLYLLKPDLHQRYCYNFKWNILYFGIFLKKILAILN